MQEVYLAHLDKKVILPNNTEKEIRRHLRDSFVLLKDFQFVTAKETIDMTQPCKNVQDKFMKGQYYALSFHFNIAQPILEGLLLSPEIYQLGQLELDQLYILLSKIYQYQGNAQLALELVNQIQEESWRVQGNGCKVAFYAKLYNDLGHYQKTLELENVKLDVNATNQEKKLFQFFQDVIYIEQLIANLYLGHLIDVECALKKLQEHEQKGNLELRVKYARSLLFIIACKDEEKAQVQFDSMINVDYFKNLDFTLLNLRSIQKLRNIIQKQRMWKQRRKMLFIRKKLRQIYKIYQF